MRPSRTHTLSVRTQTTSSHQCRCECSHSGLERVLQRRLVARETCVSVRCTCAHITGCTHTKHATTQTTQRTVSPVASVGSQTQGLPETLCAIGEHMRTHITSTCTTRAHSHTSHTRTGGKRVSKPGGGGGVADANCREKRRVKSVSITPTLT
jgi:hypothetical protein